MSSPASSLSKIAPPLGGELRDYLDRHRAELVARLAAGPGIGEQKSVPRAGSLGRDGSELGRRHAQILDGLMSALFAAAHSSMIGAHGGRSPLPMSLSAV